MVVDFKNDISTESELEQAEHELELFNDMLSDRSYDDHILRPAVPLNYREVNTNYRPVGGDYYVLGKFKKPDMTVQRTYHDHVLRPLELVDYSDKYNNCRMVGNFSRFGKLKRKISTYNTNNNSNYNYWKVIKKRKLDKSINLEKTCEKIYQELVPDELTPQSQPNTDFNLTESIFDNTKQLDEIDPIDNRVDNQVDNPIDNQVYNQVDSEMTGQDPLENLVSENEPVDNICEVSDFESEQLTTISWDDFNNYKLVVDNIDSNKEWVSPSAIKNYLMKDPLLDWLKLYYVNLGYNDTNTQMNNLPLFIQNKTSGERRNSLENEQTKCSVLFEMGNKFEDEVCRHLKMLYPGCVTEIVKDVRTDLTPESQNMTYQCMQGGVPIILQAPLYNWSNKTFGIADIIVRSDWINKIIDNPVLSDEESVTKAPNLVGNYHYRVIDIKWTTMQLCSDGIRIRNSQRFPAYKGQLAIYNAAIGQLQGYTPSKAYILAKSWKFISCSETYEGYNCFDLLGHIDFTDFDEKYLDLTKRAIDWVRNVRYNGRKWSCNPPSKEELYPNMCNRYDNPYHMVKKDLANKNHEITEIWMVGPKHRTNALENGINKWSDPNCTSESLGIYGKKIAPIVDGILDINRDKSGIKIKPDIIENNFGDWQIKNKLEFYIDFESANECFYNRHINLENSKQESGVLFMIGVGYEDPETGQWIYKPFYMNKFNQDEEKRIMDEFVKFIEGKVDEHIKKYNIKSRKLCTPVFYHWGNAEISLFRNANKRHENVWAQWAKSALWVDFCKIFVSEPILIKGAKKFNLKEIARNMYNHGFIKSKWQDSLGDGLSAMMEAVQYYRVIENYDQLSEQQKYEYNALFKSVIDYNEIDCKTVWEIVNYLRSNHTDQ
jgi:hypothetical protein